MSYNTMDEFDEYVNEEVEEIARKARLDKNRKYCLPQAPLDFLYDRYIIQIVKDGRSVGIQIINK